MKNPKMIGNADVRINGYSMGCISYTDDKVIPVGTTGELHWMLNKLKRAGDKNWYGNQR